MRGAGIIVLIIIIAGGWYWLSKDSAQAPETSGDQVANETMDASGTQSADFQVTGSTVTYTDDGYSPAEVTIPVGSTVTFVNQSTKDMWVASAMHPTHIVYSGTALADHCPDTTGTAFDQCEGGASGMSYSFTFAKEGTWKYHDHITSGKFGSIVVTSMIAQ